MSEEYQAQLDQMTKTQAKMQAELAKCDAKIKAQDQLIQRLLQVLGYGCAGMLLHSSLIDLVALCMKWRGNPS